jgi:dipeptidyl-peptidase 4
MKYIHRILLVFLLISIVQPVAAQEVLSLEEAVMGPAGALSPKTLNAVQWIPGGAGYSYIEGSGENAKIVIKNIDNRSFKEITLQELNRGVETTKYLAMRFLPTIEWLNEKEILFDYFSKVYRYNIETGETFMIMMYEDNAMNQDYNSEKFNLAYTIDNNLKVHFANGDVYNVTNHKNKDVKAGFAIHRFEFGISKGTFWSPKGNLLAFYEVDESMVTDYTLMDYTQTPAKANMVKYPMAGQASHLPKVGIFDVVGKKTIYLQTGDPAERYLTNLTWSEDEQFVYLAELNRDQNNMWLRKYDAKTGALLQTLFEEKHEKYVEPEHGPIFIPGSNGAFLWFSERDGFNHLYHYAADGKLVKQLTTGKFDVSEFLGFDAKNSGFYVGIFQPYTDLHGAKVSLKSGKMEVFTKEAGVHHLALSKDKRYLMDSFSSLEVANRIDIYDASGKLFSSLHNAPNPLQNKITGSTELFTIAAHDGTPLQARLIKPSNFDPAKKYPVFVYVYGGPHAQLITNSWLGGASLWMHYLAEQGYLVFTLDNRGSANRGLAFEQAVFRQFGTIEIQDQMRGVEHLKTLPYVDAARMAIHGWSYGGFMATSLMLRTPGTFQVGVAGGSVTDWKYYEVMYTERYMDTPQTNKEGYETAELKQYVSNLKGDLLLIHGTYDDVVVMQQSMTLLTAFIEAGVQVDFFAYPGHAHNVRGKDRVHLIDKVIKYVLEKMPAE